MQLYLTSTDYFTFEIVRKVLTYELQVIGSRNVLIVDVDIPLIGQSYGFLDKDITKFYLVERFAPNSFSPLQNFPIYVHVLIPKDISETNFSSLSQLQNIAWAELYNNYEVVKGVNSNRKTARFSDSDLK